MSFMALNSAISGLRIAQQQLNVISTNVSNATTPGYSRKILPQSTQVINSTGQVIGVRSDAIIRNVDLNLERELWTEVSGVAASDVKASYLDMIEKFHGASNKEISIAAQIAQLKDKFAALSDSPADSFLLQGALNQAELVASKFNDFGKMITQMRNDAQDEMVSTVNRVNDLLQSIAKLNADIKANAAVGRSTASLADKRDEAIKELSSNMQITTFMRGDGVMVIQSRTGVQLADHKAEEIYFNPDHLGVQSFYPDSASGIYVGGDPARNVSAIDITATGLGGKLGGLVELRDDMLVRYQVQIDELAHKTALRLEAQGLRLFTDQSGTVPSDAPPDLGTNPPTPVSYVGFASTIQVSTAVKNDITLIQQGTYTSDRTIPSASNEVIRRVIQYGFGDIHYQEAAGSTDLNVAAPATDLQQWLGLYSSNNITGGINLTSFPQISDGVAGTSDLMADLQEFFSDPLNDRFQMTFSDPRLGIPDMTIEVDLSDAQAAFPLNPPAIRHALDQINAQINALVAAEVAIDPALAGHNVVATGNQYGQLSVQSRSNVTFSASGFPNAMGSDAMGALGWQERTYATEDPYFDIQVGSGTPMRITIAPGDDINDLIAKLEYNPATNTGVPGLRVEFDVATGFLTLRPGMDDSNGGPAFGGDIRIVSGPAKTNGAVNGALAGLPQSVSIVGALFGNYTVSGTTVNENPPTQNIRYRSETFAGSNVYVDFRQDYLGPSGRVFSGIMATANIVDFSQKMVNAHGQDISLNKAKRDDAATVRDMLQDKLTNDSGVNIDEELSHLIVIQTAYSAAARAVTTASEMFDELLRAF